MSVILRTTTFHPVTSRPSVFAKCVFWDWSKDQSPLGICGFGALGEGRGEAQTDAQATHACGSRWGMLTSGYFFFWWGGVCSILLFKLFGNLWLLVGPRHTRTNCRSIPRDEVVAKMSSAGRWAGTWSHAQVARIRIDPVLWLTVHAMRPAIQVRCLKFEVRGSSHVQICRDYSLVLSFWILWPVAGSLLAGITWFHSEDDQSACIHTHTHIYIYIRVLGKIRAPWDCIY